MQKINKSGSSNKRGMPKFLYGALIGVVVGVLVVTAGPAVATYSFVALLVVAAYVFLLKRQQSGVGQWQPSPFAAGPALGALMIGAVSIAGVQYLGVSLAWHPQGKIIKTVQNMTTPSQVLDANTAATALQAKPGDILTYSITVLNAAAPANKQYNDMAFTVMTDTLPAGVELVSNPSTRTLTENMGTILPGKSVTKTYQVKVIATSAGLIENKACFNADSVVKDNPQKGCDVAITTVTTPTPPTPTPPTPTPPTPTPPTPTPPTPTPPTPTPPTPTPPTPTPPTPTPPTPNTPNPTPPNPTTVTVAPTPPPATTTTSAEGELPNAGSRNVIIIALFTVVAGYLVSALYGLFAGNRVKRFSSR